MTPAEIIKQYVALRDYKEELVKQQKAALKPYNDALDTLENALLEQLNADAAQSIKTEFGTAFKKTSMTVKTVDKDALFDFVRSTENFSMLTAAVSKEALKEYMEENEDRRPPGVDVTFFTEVQVRRN